MAKGSRSKKVSRAASTGGGRTSRGARPWGYNLFMVVVVVLGLAIIWQSRDQRQAASNPAKAEKPRPPQAGGDFRGDHWHAAYGVYICDKFEPPITSDNDPLGIHTHNDGLIHIHPFTRAASGRKATLRVFLNAVGMTLTDDKLKMPGGKTFEDGDKCGNKRAKVRVFLNGDERLGDPRKIRLRDRDELVLAFAPGDADVPEKPPSASGLDSVTDVIGGPTTTSPSAEVTIPAESTPTSAPGTSTPATSAPTTPAPTTATTARGP